MKNSSNKHEILYNGPGPPNLQIIEKSIQTPSHINKNDENYMPTCRNWDYE